MRILYWDVVSFIIWLETIYVMELKLNGSAQDALDQINGRGYALRYSTDGRRIVKVGIGFSVDKRTMTDYIIQE